MDPQIVFLDEPSAGLDPITSAELDELILRLSQALKVTFVIVTHDPTSIYAIADRVIMLDKRAKGIVATGKPEDLRDHSDHPWVQQFFHLESVDEGVRRVRREERGRRGLWGWDVVDFKASQPGDDGL